MAQANNQSKTNFKNPDIQDSFWRMCGKPIFDSLPIGIIIFDSDLKIIETNDQTAKLIDIDAKIDDSLAKVKNTDNPDRQNLNWTQLLKSVLKQDFKKVSYTLNGQTKLLRIVCLPCQPLNTTQNFGILLVEDITKEIDLQRQLADAERLTIAGKLVSKVVHELNNPMDGILRYINLAIRSIEQQNLEKPKEYLLQCRQGLMRMVQIVSELLEFSRRTYTFLEYVEIEQIIEDAIKTMEGQVNILNIRIVRDYAPGLPKIRTDSLFQVFCNLIKNALDAMPNGGQLKISIHPTADNTIVVKVSDTGIGFAPEHSQAIFEPFFTTKEKGKGTGLGLAICKDIIERYGGKITAENAPQGGSIFTVYLPMEN
jgi:two-component system, NtrC family, sensor kinase